MPTPTSSPGRAPPRGRQRALLALKVAAAIGLLAWLVASSRLDLDHLRSIPTDGRTTLLVLVGVGAVWGGMVLLAWRLMLILGLAGIDVGLRRAAALTAVGLFCGTVLPGAVGGDIVKIVLLSRGEAADRRLPATAAVIYERVIGLFSLFVLGLLALVAARVTDSLPFRSPVLLIAPAAVAVMVAGYAIEARWHPLSGRVATGSVRWLPQPVCEALAVGAQFTDRPAILLACVALSVVNHLLVCGTFLIGAVLLRSQVPLLQQLLLDPLAMVINTIPVTPGGVGTTESAFSYLYAAAGCSLGAALGIIGRLVQYGAYAVAGLPAFLLTRNR